DQQKLDSAHERDEDGDRRDARNAVEADELRDEEHDAKQERERRHHEPEVEREPEWIGGEADDAVGREPEHLAQRVLRLTCIALVAVKRDADLAVADPAEHAAHIAVGLAHRAKGIDSTPVDETEVADVERDVDVADPPEHAVEERRRRALERSVALAALAHGVDDVVPVAPASGELERHFGWILE